MKLLQSKFLLVAWLACGSLNALAGSPLTESTFTEIIKEVNVVSASGNTVTPARTNELFKSPDMVRTGQVSRVELTAKDQTITRIGANTTFAFIPAERGIQLKKGSVLFHSPAGAGGGTIKNRGSSAAVLGTTMICTVLPDGSFKVMNLEGSVKVTIAGGGVVILEPGQMVTVSADGTVLGNVSDFNLGQVVAQLQIVSGFSKPVSSWQLIEAAIQKQDAEIAAGKLPNLSPLNEAVAGMATRNRNINDPVFFTINPGADGNPLNFPGNGEISSFPSQSEILLQQIPATISINEPEKITNVDPIMQDSP